MGMREVVELAGMAAGNGQIGNPIPPGMILIPVSIEPEKEWLRWDLVTNLDGTFSEPKVKRPPSDLVDEFIRLKSATPDKIASFARRYGVLGLDLDGTFPDRFSAVRGKEPIKKWRRIAAHMSAMLHLAALLYTDSTVKPEDIAAICDHVRNYQRYPNPERSPNGWYYDAACGPVSVLLKSPSGEAPFPTSKRDCATIAKCCLDSELEDWLKRFPSNIIFVRTREGLDLQMNYVWGLPSVLGLQLALAIARKSVYFCSACKEPFVRAGGSNEERKPRAEGRTFCVGCGKRAAVRLADERRRERVRKANELFESGLTDNEVAAALNTTAKTARKWRKEKK